MKITQNCSRFLLLVIILGFAMWAVLLPPAAQAKKLNVVTSTTDMAALTQEVGADKLAEMDANDSAYFQQQFQDFDKRLTAAEQKWDQEMQPYHGRKVVTYHRSFPNFAKHFDLDVIGYVEPRPGIPPTPSHTIELIQLMKRENCKVVLVEPYFDLKTPQSIGQATGAQVIVYLPSVGGEKQVTNYFQLFDYDIALLIKAFNATK